MWVSSDVSAPQAVNDAAQDCQWDEAVNQIRDIKLTIRDELTEVKNLLGSRQQRCEFGVSDSSSIGKCSASMRSIFIRLCRCEAAELRKMNQRKCYE